VPWRPQGDRPQGDSPQASNESKGLSLSERFFLQVASDVDSSGVLCVIADDKLPEFADENLPVFVQE